MMRRFAHKLICLFLLISLITVLVSLLNIKASSSKLRSDAYILAPGIDTVLAGDSHAETSLDPSLIPGSVNISMGGERIFYTYYKLKHFIARNPNKIKKIILSFGYHNIARKFQEEYLLGDYSTYSLERYYLYLDSDAKRIICDGKYYMMYHLKYDWGMPLMEYTEFSTNDWPFNSKLKRENIYGFGGFNHSASAKIDKKDANIAIGMHYFDKHSNYTGYSQIMIDSLEKIALLSDNNNIKLYLYNAPSLFRVGNPYGRRFCIGRESSAPDWSARRDERPV